jgi:hypothetical protein
LGKKPGIKRFEKTKLSPVQKILKLQLPLRHKDTKVHQELKFNDLFLVKLCDLEPWWQKKTLKDGLKIVMIIQK